MFVFRLQHVSSRFSSFFSAAAVPRGEAAKASSVLKASKQVVLSFCEAGVAHSHVSAKVPKAVLCDRHNSSRQVQHFGDRHRHFA